MSITLLGLAGCSSYPPIRTESHVDLQSFMGKWYVIASIPTFIETDAYNAVESYKLNPDGTVATTFTYRKGGFDGKRKTWHPTGFVTNTQSNAVWEMQFFWPFKSDYRIVYVDDDYTVTIIGRIKRDYVWIMARKPHIDAGEYGKLLKIIEAQGYDISLVKTVPQQWD